MSVLNGVTAPFVRVEYDAALPLGPKDPADCDWTLVPTEYVRSVSIRRGKTQENQVVQPGEATIVLDNRSGDFDPMNSDSPYWFELISPYGGMSYFSPNLGVRIVATWDEVDYVLYIGFLEQLDLDYGLNPTATVTFVDVMAYVAKRDIAAIPFDNGATPPVPIPAVGEGDPVYFRCDRILDQISFPAGLRGIDESVDNTLYGTRYGADALTLLQTTVNCGPARLFVDVDGLLRVLRWDGGDDSGLVLSDDVTNPDVVGYDLIDVDPGARYLLNTVTINKVDGDNVNRGAVVRTNAASVLKFGIYDATYDLPTNTAAPLATTLANQYANPIDRVKHITFSMANLGANFVKVLVSDIADAVTVERTTFDGRSLGFGCLIEGVDHDITPDSWRAGFTCSTTEVAGAYWIGGFDYSDVYGSSYTSTGSIYVSATQDDVVGFNDGAILAKYSADGSVLWQRSLSSASVDMLPSFELARDVDNNVYAPVNKGLVSYSSDGVLNWQKKGSTSAVFSAVYDPLYGDIFCVGSNSPYFANGYIARVSPDGSMVWEYDVGGDSWFFQSAAFLQYFLLTAGFQQNYLGVFPTLMMVDNTGAFQFGLKSPVSIGAIERQTVATYDGDGNLYWAFQTSATTFCLIKTDGGGVTLWQRELSTANTGLIPRSIAVDGNAVFVAGADVAGYSGSSFIVKYDLDGVLLWQRKLTGSSGLKSLRVRGSKYMISGVGGTTSVRKSFTSVWRTTGAGTGTSFTFGGTSMSYTFGTLTDSASSYVLEDWSPTLTVTSTSWTDNTLNDAAGTATYDVLYF